MAASGRRVLPARMSPLPRRATMSLRVWGFRITLALLATTLLVPSLPAEEKPSLWLEFFDTLTSPFERLRELQARRQLEREIRQLDLMLEKMERQSRMVTPLFAQAAQPEVKTPMPPWVQLLPYIEQDNLWKYYWSAYAAGNERLGAPVEPVSAALASQLKLAKDQGQLIGEVKKDSPADKAGIKTHDILLEMDGKPVPRAADAFDKALSAIKAGMKINVVVLREGQKVEVKGVPVQEAKPLNILDGTSNTILLGEGRFPAPIKTYWVPSDPGTSGKGYQVIAREPTLTTVFRDGKRYTSRLEEGNLIITVVGEGEAKIEVIKVQDGSSE